MGQKKNIISKFIGGYKNMLEGKPLNDDEIIAKIKRINDSKVAH